MMHQFTYSRPELERLVSKLRVKIEPRYRNLKQPAGPQGRLDWMREIVNGIIKYERLELGYTQATEARGYIERLISEAIRHGDNHKETMEFANYYIKEKQYVHKLFKVLVPRFQDYTTAYTNLYKAPLKYPEGFRARSVLELKGNPFPPMVFDGSRNRNLIHNVLFDEARKDYHREKKAEVAAKVKSSEDIQRQISDSSESKKDMSKAAQDVSEGEELLKACSIENEFEDESGSQDVNNNPIPVV